jgi:hypothetical protein
LRRIGTARLEKWLRGRHAYNASDLATRAVEAANCQRTVVAGQRVAATVVLVWLKPSSTSTPNSLTSAP